MHALTFAELPQTVREAVVEHSGRVSGFEPAPAGNHAAIAGSLRIDGGRVFVKGARLLPERGGGAEAWSLRNEAAVNPYVRPRAPELLWQVQADGWLVMGYEHVDGRHADYAPGSPDLEAVAEAVHGLSVISCPEVVMLRVEQRYASQDEDASALAGPALLHCNINPENVLIAADGRARLVDWAFTSRGAAWLELGFVLPWLLRAGHTVEAAESWLAGFQTWKTADPANIDLFVSLLHDITHSKSVACQWANAKLVDRLGLCSMPS